MRLSLMHSKKYNRLQRYFFIPTLLLQMLSTMHAAEEQTQQNLVESVTIDKNRVSVVINEKLKRKYLRENFFAEYASDIDLTKLDQSIVLIPFIASIMPVIWLSGDEYYINTMDAAFASSLEEIREVFKTFYPATKWSGSLIPRRLVENKKAPAPNIDNQEAIAVLFSGGVDAVCTSLRHYQTKQLLITAWGSDVPTTNSRMWEGVKKHCHNFAATHGYDYTFVKSNFISFLRHSKLSHASREIPFWWGLTSQGLGYCGLTAPILISKGYRTLRIASTHTKDYPYPYGTHPWIDNKIAFGNVKVFHDSYDFNRQQKLAFIINVSKDWSEKPFLRVCWGKSATGGNCCKCEKCLRTITGLLIEGASPNNYGFRISTPDAIQRLKERFTGKSPFRFRGGISYKWQDMQARSKEILDREDGDARYWEEMKNFARWFITLNMNKYRVYAKPPFQKLPLTE